VTGQFYPSGQLIYSLGVSRAMSAGLPKEGKLNLIILETAPEAVRAGYDCPCGCHPDVSYARRAAAGYDQCCCGNEFALGPTADMMLADRAGFARHTELVRARWGESLEAVWLVGPSTHSEAAGHDHGTRRVELPVAPAQQTTEAMDSAIDPVCGMTVDRETQRSKGLVSTYEGREYFFCGKGCKLDFDDDPGRYFESGYTPSM
jgi:YHS domain-containing protein